MNDALKERPVYRHIIVKRRGYIEAVASPEDLRRLRQQVESESPIDDDLKHLFVADTLKKTIKKVMAWSGHGDVAVEASSSGLDPSAVLEEAEAMKQRGTERDVVSYRKQEGIIVSRINTNQVPGGRDEPLPSEPTMLMHPGFDQAENPEAEYMKCAMQLQEQIRDYSDRKFRLMDPQMQAAVTLVTVCITPITAAPRADVGLELYCEFHQTTRFGFVDTEGFEVYSEVGDFPYTPPSSMDLMMMMMTRDALGITISATRPTRE